MKQAAKFINSVKKRTARLASQFRGLPVLGDFLLARACASDIRKANKWINDIRGNPMKGAPEIPLFRKFDVEECADLPKANWRVIISEQGVVKVRYGASVERTVAGIFEGVWDGDFTKFDFDLSSNVYGSGVKFSEESLIFTPASHSRDCIHVIFDKRNGDFIFSNSIISSLACVPQSYRENLTQNMADIAHIKYDRMTAAGVFNYDPILYQDDNCIFYSFMYHNLVLKQGQTAVLLPRLKVEYFDTYNEYIKFMVSVIGKLIANGSDNSRKTKLSPLSTISNGYDSPAVSVLCARAGVKRFATIDVRVYGNDDSGKHIADFLGLDCELCEHPFGPEIQDLNSELGAEYLKEMEMFLATQGIGDNIAWKAFDRHIADSLFFTGSYGDTLWARDMWRHAGLPLLSPYEKSFSEYRLEKGFAYIPVPAIGMQFPKSLFQLSGKKEMRKWMVKGSYDRPIARRIIEEAGVPRGTFAVEKAATNPHPKNILSHKRRSYLSRLARYPEP